MSQVERVVGMKYGNYGDVVIEVYHKNLLKMIETQQNEWTIINN